MKIARFIFLFVLFSCSTKESSNSHALDSLLITKAIDQGNRISSLAQQTLGSNLMKQVRQNGPEKAVAFCNVAAYPLLDTLDTGLEVKIKRAAIKARNSKDLPTELERTIIERFNLAIQKQQPIKPVVEVLGSNDLLYAAPIQTKNDFCLQCHGSELTDISEATLSKIKSLYPKDRATGHQVGDLRGIWSITFNKEQLLAFESPQQQALNGAQLLQQNCNSCHNPLVSSHDLVIAPPMEAVKRRYLSRFTTKEAFTSSMIAFLKDPSKENAIMKGPAKRFGVMPKFQWSDESLRGVVTYIYENELEQPEWFEKHYEEKHGK